MKDHEITREKAEALLKHMHEKDVTLGTSDGMSEYRKQNTSCWLILLKS